MYIRSLQRIYSDVHDEALWVDIYLHCGVEPNAIGAEELFTQFGALLAMCALGLNTLVASVVISISVIESVFAEYASGAAVIGALLVSDKFQQLTFYWRSVKRHEEYRVQAQFFLVLKK